jgi:histidinol-phosphate aminotransferase
MHSDHLKRLIGDHISKAKAPTPPTGRKPFIKLDLNEGYHFLNDEILNELRSFDPLVISTYPEYSSLLGKLAKYVGVNENQVCLTNGSDHGIQMIAQLFAKEGDEIVIPAPTFFVYFSVLSLLGAKAVPVEYEKGDKTFVFPFEKTMAALDNLPKALFLCTPSNPLGNSIPQNQLDALLEKTATLNIPVVIDEAYAEFAGHSSTHFLEQYSHVIILRSFSKAFGLAGLRLGYFVSTPAIIAELEKLKLAWTVNHFSVFAGEVVLGHVHYFRQKIEEAKELKQELTDLLRGKGYECYETDTNFIIVRVPAHAALISTLKEAGILVSDVSHYPHSGTLLENCIRVSMPSQEDLKKLRKTVEGI